ncbi:MAG: hypothetical protein KF718_10110 [Polyangiaceae bacterium]|nr:hypothetical protein [Polyangiaceae bacterium]
MRLLHIPLSRLRGLASGCPDLLDALREEVEADRDPTIKILRVVGGGESPRWYVSVGQRVLPLDSTNLVAMSAATPVFIVDLLQDLQEELAPVFAEDGMMGAVERAVPFVRGFRPGKPS